MITIIDNFLDEKDFNDLKAFSKSNKVRYTPQFFDGTIEKKKKKKLKLNNKIIKKKKKK